MGHSQPSQSSLRWFLGPGQLPLQSLWPHILTPGPQDSGGGQCKGKGGPTQPGPMSPGATQRSGAQPASPSPPPSPSLPTPRPQRLARKEPKGTPSRRPEVPSSPQTQGQGGQAVRVDAENITVQKTQQAQNDTAQASKLGEGRGHQVPGSSLCPRGAPSPGVSLQTRSAVFPGQGAAEASYVCDFKLRCLLHCVFFFFNPINFQIPSNCDCI